MTLRNLFRLEAGQRSFHYDNLILILDSVPLQRQHFSASKTSEEANSDEQVSKDTAAYYEYRDEGGLEADLAKLRELVEEV